MMRVLDRDGILFILIVFWPAQEGSFEESFPVLFFGGIRLFLHDSYIYYQLAIYFRECYHLLTFRS